MRLSILRTRRSRGVRGQVVVGCLEFISPEDDAAQHGAGANSDEQRREQACHRVLRFGFDWRQFNASALRPKPGDARANPSRRVPTLLPDAGARPSGLRPRPIAHAIPTLLESRTKRPAGRAQQARLPFALVAAQLRRLAVVHKPHNRPAMAGLPQSATILSGLIFS